MNNTTLLPEAAELLRKMETSLAQCPRPAPPPPTFPTARISTPSTAPHAAPCFDGMSENEFKKRVCLANQAQAAIEMGLGRPFGLTALRLSALMVMPPESLRMVVRWLEMGPRELAEGLSESLGTVESLMRMCRFSVEASSAAERGLDRHSNRDRKVMRDCLARDGGKCVVTGRDDAVACYILPFSRGSAKDAQQESFRLFSHARMFLVEAKRFKFARWVFQMFLGCHNQRWNLIYLSQQLCDWWSQGCFGLKCVDILPEDDYRSTVRIQFHWLAQEPVAQGKGDSDSEHSYGVQPPEGDPRQEETSVQQGKTFGIVVKRREAEMMKVALDLQWAVLRIGSMSSLVEKLDVFERRSEQSDIDRVAGWMDNLKFPDH
ncbi:hypothetical protein B0T25DRAFT_117681 [Lasiosphaeria hispida]|uniref:HNH nuclease domain-containing protein n=1 Tax=Lasiosphaeria hispida TaxID=260671 RepID=A0AAJ0HRA2_9PEZI|nr:hypothetical protein B0T25DRAFT_117681 [Lasiosphaeria hispida]